MTQVIANFIGHRLEKNAFVAKGVEIEFQRFQLDAGHVGYIAHGDIRKIGMPGNGANGGKLVMRVLNNVIAVRRRIGKGLENLRVSHIERFGIKKGKGKIQDQSTK